MVERERHDRHRNLVVAATGTGKTVVAALDYRQLVERAAATCRCCSSRTARRSCGSRWPRTARCCATASFGEIHGGGRIADGRHVFAMVQSLQRRAARADRAGHLRRRRRRRVPSRRGGDLRPAAQAPPADGAARADRDARAPRRPGRHGVVRPAHRRRAAALGGDRPGLPRAVPVLRRRRRHRPAARSPGGAAATSPRSSATSVQRRPPRREAPGGDPADRARSGLDARARVLRLQGARALHGAQVHRGRPRERRAHRRRRARRA